MLGTFGGHALGTGKDVETQFAIIGAPLGGGNHNPGMEIAVSGIEAEANDVPLLNFYRAT